jgi:Transposase domain (DUF772)
MGRQTVDQSQLFYLFNLERRIPARHLLRRINPTVTRILAEFREKLQPFYSEIGRPSIDPELMIRMLIVGYCYGIRFERKLCEEVELHLAYRLVLPPQRHDPLSLHGAITSWRATAAWPAVLRHVHVEHHLECASGHRSFQTTATHVMSSDWRAPFANSATRLMTCSTTLRAGWPRISSIVRSRRFIPN